MAKLLRSILVLVSLHLSSFGIAQEQSQNNNAENEILFKIFKTEDQGLTINDILDATNDFKTPDNFTEKTHPDDIYWIQLNFRNQLDNLNSNAPLHLKLNTFDYASAFYQNNGTIVKNLLGDLI